MLRKYTRKIFVGNVQIGDGAPVSVQSMTSTDTRDISSTISQIKRLETKGCEIVRVAVPDEEAVFCLKKIKESIGIPLIADIHFDYKLAINALKNGADAVRINPGNIGGVKKLSEVVRIAKDLGRSIRVGVNAGSLERDILKSHGVTSHSLILSALRLVEFLENINFTNFKLSLKASNVPMTLDAYRKISKITDYPLHIGVTEAGTPFGGTIKSAVGIGTLLAEGIGDTLRVSLTGDPVKEVEVAWEILKSLEIRKKGPQFISCPTCGRTEIDLEHLACDIESALKNIKSEITIAVMGCPVNGPGEAREADYGIAGGKGVGIIFKKGEVVEKVPQENLLKCFMDILKSDGHL